MPAFETERLICKPLSLLDYASFELGEEPQWNGFSNPFKHLVEGHSPLVHRIPRVKIDPSFAEIGLILAIEKSENIIIGSAGFHDQPDENGMIEIGFGIVPDFQNRGYGKELLHGMWKMILEDSRVKTLRYTVSKDNAPSMHIIENLNFNLVGEQIDEEDGPELIFELSSEDYKSRFGVN